MKLLQEHKVVIVGAGQAATQLAMSLRDEGHQGPVLVIGDEGRLPYQRPPLSKGLLLGSDEPDDLTLEDGSTLVDAAIELVRGDRACHIDRATRTVVLASGQVVEFDVLVLATGARNRPLPCAGAPVQGLMGIRTMDEALALRERLGHARRMVVVGAGFLGLEAAGSAVERGLSVQVVEAEGQAMQRVLSRPAAAAVVRHHVARGVGFCFGRTVAKLHTADGALTGVELDDGRLLEADLVLVAIGVLPNTDLASAAGLLVENGIVVDDRLATSDPSIFAIGDCAAFPMSGGSVRGRLESVQNAVDQARFLACHLRGHTAAYDQIPMFWSEQCGLRLQMSGLAQPGDAAVVRGDPGSAAFSVFRFRGRRLTAVESINRPVDMQLGRRLLAACIDPDASKVEDTAFDLRALLG